MKKTTISAITSKKPLEKINDETCCSHLCQHPRCWKARHLWFYGDVRLIPGNSTSCTKFRNRYASERRNKRLPPVKQCTSTTLPKIVYLNEEISHLYSHVPALQFIIDKNAGSLLSDDILQKKRPVTSDSLNDIHRTHNSLRSNASVYKQLQTKKEKRVSSCMHQLQPKSHFFPRKKFDSNILNATESQDRNKQSNKPSYISSSSSTVVSEKDWSASKYAQSTSINEHSIPLRSNWIQTDDTMSEPTSKSSDESESTISPRSQEEDKIESRFSEGFETSDDAFESGISNNERQVKYQYKEPLQELRKAAKRPMHVQFDKKRCCSADANIPGPSTSTSFEETSLQTKEIDADNEEVLEVTYPNKDSEAVETSDLSPLFALFPDLITTYPLQTSFQETVSTTDVTKQLVALGAPADFSNLKPASRLIPPHKMWLSALEEVSRETEQQEEEIMRTSCDMSISYDGYNAEDEESNASLPK